MIGRERNPLEAMKEAKAKADASAFLRSPTPPDEAMKVSFGLELRRRALQGTPLRVVHTKQKDTGNRLPILVTGMSVDQLANILHGIAQEGFLARAEIVANENSRWFPLIIACYDANIGGKHGVPIEIAKKNSQPENEEDRQYERDILKNVDHERPEDAGAADPGADAGEGHPGGDHPGGD